MTEAELEQADAEISRCIDCGDWRWRASYLACQQCGATCHAARISPPQDLTPTEYAVRWKHAERAWTGSRRRRKAAA